jgi:hypothetical protein
LLLKLVGLFARLFVFFRVAAGFREPDCNRFDVAGRFVGTRIVLGFGVEVFF